ncbi:MAG: hypothetical protein AMK69_20035 [Nitrospira bacterium SG8_3]|nr:MAG: hypothetical protein AMK69_20035 [Nitrospira bacterium SG8_3]
MVMPERRKGKSESNIERGRDLEEVREREWNSILCPERQCRTIVMCEWDVLSKEGRILKRTLKQIDCHNVELAQFGGADCKWGCEGVIRKRER